MSKLLVRIIPAFIFWGIFIFVVFKIPYPETFAEASYQQLLLFFIPLFLALVFTLNIFLKNFLSASSISLGLIFLLILKALDALNLVTAALIFIAVGLLISYFSKMKKHKSLTNYLKIPKLTQLRRK